MNGVTGLNVRTLGVNRDNILAAARTLGGNYILAQDDPELAARAASMGLRVVYRQSGDETLSLDPAAFVAERAKNAPAAAFIHTTNELDPTPELLAWTTEAIRYANTLGRKLCILNYSTHRSGEQWQASANVCRAAIASGHAVGVHVYSQQAFDASATSFYSLKNQLGGMWICSEFGYAIDAHHGWRGTLSEAQYADFCARWMQFFADEDMPALLFSFDHWTHNDAGKAHGFGVNDAPEFLSALAGLNTKHPLQEQPTVPPTPPLVELGLYALTKLPADWVNVRVQPSINGTDLGNLYKGDVLTLHSPTVDGWVYIAKDALKGWVSLQNGAVVFTPASVDTPYALGIDVSQAQMPIAWNAVQRTGYSFAFIRATQGVVNSKPVGMDTRFRQHIDSALLAGMEVGTYHALIASVDGGAQAQFYFTAIAPYLDRLAFPPAIDVELTNGQQPNAIAERLRAMCLMMEALIGIKPMIYTAPGWWDSHVGSQWDAYFATLPLWVAHWTSADEPILPRPWKRGTWTVWQYSSSAQVDGVSSKRVDVNRLKSSHPSA